MEMEMEMEYGWNDGNGRELQSKWLQSKLSDLEENTNSMLNLINIQNGDSFAQRAEWYYQKKPELEERIAKYQKLYHLLLSHYSFVQIRPSFSSISTINNSETDSVKIGSSKSNPKLCVEDFDRAKNSPKLSEMYEKKVSKLSEITGGEKLSQDVFEIELSNSNSNPKLCEGSDREKKNPKLREFFEENTPKLSQMCEKNMTKPSEITGDEKMSGDIFEKIVDFEKRISCSEELVEENKRFIDESTSRYEQKNEATEKLKQQIGALMKQIESLRNENLMLLSEKKRPIKEVIMDRIKEKKRSKFCFGRILRKIGIKRLKGLAVKIKRKISIKRFKSLVKRRIISIERFGDLVKRKIMIERFKDLVKRKISILRLKLGLIKRNISIRRFKLGVIKRKISFRKLKLYVEKFIFSVLMKCL